MSLDGEGYRCLQICVNFNIFWLILSDVEPIIQNLTADITNHMDQGIKHKLSIFLCIKLFKR